MSVDLFILISLFDTIVTNSKYNFDVVKFVQCKYVYAVTILDYLWFNPGVPNLGYAKQLLGGPRL